MTGSRDLYFHRNRDTTRNPVPDAIHGTDKTLSRGAAQYPRWDTNASALKWPQPRNCMMWPSRSPTAASASASSTFSYVRSASGGELKMPGGTPRRRQLLSFEHVTHPANGCAGSSPAPVGGAGSARRAGRPRAWRNSTRGSR